MINHHILYGQGAYGTNVWEIWSVDNIIHIHANGGAYHETVEKGLGGRNLAQQVELRVNARVRGKLDGGFKRTKEELTGVITNQLGLVAPMLAKPSKGRTIPFGKDGIFAQPKLDGHRCLINPNEAYSRRGKIINTIPEIQETLNIENGVTIDGELYHHGTPLQTIGSWAKRRQPNTLKLTYNIYDVIIPGISFTERLAYIRSLKLDERFSRLVESTTLYNYAEVEQYFGDCRRNKYEGSILRVPKGLYEIGKRSANLLKVKSRHSAEFVCVDVVPSRTGLGKLVLLTEEGLEFTTPAPGDNYTKRRTLDNKEHYKGKVVTCEYAERTLDNKPFHCVAMYWRKDL